MRAPYRILGVDPGSRATGWGLLEVGPRGIRALAWGAIRPSGRTLAHRIRDVHEGLGSLLLAHRPATVVVESLFTHRNARSALLLGHVRGAVLLAAAQAGTAVIEYAPAEVKKAVTGYGRAEKLQVQKMVRTLLALETLPRPADAADALALTLCHAARLRVPLTPRRIAGDRPNPSLSRPGRPVSADSGRPVFRRKPRG